MSTRAPDPFERPVSLSQFYPFVLADALAKRGRASSARRTQGPYTPAVDYWRLLRLQIQAHHRYGPDGRPDAAAATDPTSPSPAASLDALDTAVELTHPDRKDHYREAVANYRRFLGRKRIEWLGQPRRVIWLADRLQVRVNPELHVTINGEPHVVKLWLKADPRQALDQRTANPLAWLINDGHGHLGRPLVVDVLRGRAFGLTRPGYDYESLLRAQAAAFESLWEADPGEANGGTAAA